MACRPRLAVEGGLANLGSLHCAMLLRRTGTLKALHSQTGIFTSST
ncbi:hypothetical protein [Adhaeribacter radiodurans]|uniref:Uncharacterized protein n=1 Tax=Adhaeribacter radiodurans TaxID=2745197 RepID=A0A7L7LEK0_9BACT|nr:hypothetical protein [Adhaeribacter radiodurans]QMU31203.1 hypothetical protein HUW48_25655 [Adhaeribacter radiodurans]